MNKLYKILLCVIALTLSVAAYAGDVAAGKEKSALCAACHGADGISLNEIWPNLKGQKEAYIIKQLKAFKDGSRTDPMMSPMAAPLTDDDVANVAAYFSSL